MKKLTEAETIMCAAARVKLGWPNADVEASAPKRSPRYSFRMPDGRLPMVGGKLSWVADRQRAEAEAKSWGAVAIVILHENAAGKWDIVEEIPLPNATGHATADNNQPTQENGN